MKRIFKIFFAIFFFLLLSISTIYATDNTVETVFLQHENVINMDSLQSQSLNTIYQVPNESYQTIYSQKENTTNTLCQDLNIFESKAGQAFYRFINNRVVNNQFNLFSMYLGEKQRTISP